MKKIITLPMLLATFGMAHQVIVDNHTFVNVNVNNPIVEANGVQQTDYSTLKLSLNIHNSENRTKKIRIAGKFSGLDAQKKYYISGCDVNKVPGIDAMVNFYESSRVGQRVLDVMLDVPQGDKNLCIALRENYWTPVVNELVSIDWKGSADGNLLDYVTGSSPIDNNVVYNYIDKRQKRDLMEQTGKLASGQSFSAKTLYNSEAVGLTEREKFESYDPNPEHAKYVNAVSLIDLHIGSYGAYKDTRMLMASLGAWIDKYRWNESSFDGHIGFFTEAEERMFSMGRCWALGVFNIYSYLHGNRNTIGNALTQDEMVYKGKEFESSTFDRKYGFFVPHYGEGNYDVWSAKLMNWAMHGANAKSYNFKQNPIGGPEIYDFIKEDADGKGKPLFISIDGIDGEPGHVMVIDGVALTNDASRDTLVHLINLDNFGNEAYVYLDGLKKMLTGYVTYDMPIGFESSNQNHPVDIDTDGDGVVDFDEYYRFETDETPYSSDANEVSDFEKIYNSTIVLPILEEKKNNMFVVDYSFYPSVDKLTLYALEYLSVNDNVSCYGIVGTIANSPWNASGDVAGCHIASESTYETNAVNLGVNSFVGAVFSKGGILVRNRAWLSNATLYNLDRNVYKVNYQDNQSANIPVVYLDPMAWPFAVDRTLESISSRINNGHKIVRNGETFTISGEPGHNGFSFLKVESGGTLVIGTGEMYIGDIQIESGSTFMFEHPAVKSELHLNGNFIWRGTYAENPSADIRFEDIDHATARGFKLFQHSPREMYIDSDWHGTIVAPYSKVVLGQASTAKKIYGRAMGKRVVVHQRSKVYDVPYNPEIPSLAKKAADQAETEKEVSAVIPSSVKITGASRNTINFTTTTPGQFLISVVKLDGSVVASFMVDRDVAGAGSVDWNSENVPNGAYMLSVKHNGKSSGKMITLK